MKILEPRVTHNFFNGVIEGDSVSTSKKLYKDAKSFYVNGDKSLNDDTLMYEVYSYSDGDAKQVGNLNWGLTILKPVYVDGECNMTRGHFHEDLNSAEFYFGLAGEGLLLFMDDKGECFAEKVYPNSLHHIDGKYAHRLINVGDSDFKVGACWPSTAGHNYKQIEDSPFTVRVYKENDQIVTRDVK